MATNGVSLKAAKAFLEAKGVDYSDCFEKCDLLARFAAIKVSAERNKIERAKAKANGAFKRQSHACAVRLYTDAIAQAFMLHSMSESGASSWLTVLLANRAAAYLQLNLPRRALHDALLCVHLDGQFMKGHARVAAAYTALGKPDFAATHYRIALDLVTSDRDRVHMQAQLDAAQLAATPSVSSALPGSEAGELKGERAQEHGQPPPSPPQEADLGCPLLSLLTEDLLAAVLCELRYAVDLSAAASSCHALYAAAAAQASGGGWHTLCLRQWPEAAKQAAECELARRGEATAALATVLEGVQPAPGSERAGQPDAQSVLAVDWQLLVREQVELDRRWESGRGAVYSVLGAHRGGFGTGNVRSGSTYPVYNIRLCGDLALTASEDALLGVWDLASRRTSPVMVCEGHDTGVLGAWMDSEGKRAVSGGFDGTLRIWDISGAAEAGNGPLGEDDASARSATAPPPEPPLARAPCVRCCVGDSGPVVSIECSERNIFASSFDGCVRLWDWSGQQVRSIGAHDGHCSGLELVEGGGRFLSGGDDGMARLWDTETGEMILMFAAGRGGAVWSIRHCPNRQHVLTGATNGCLVQTDMRSGRVVHAHEAAHDDAIAGVQLDDFKVVTASFDSSCKIWDLRMGLTLRTTLLAPPLTRCTRCAYDESKIVAGSLCGNVVLFDFA
jgi:hypothetical protein